MNLIYSFSILTTIVTMADPAFNPGPQPSFPLMAKFHQTLATESEMIANVPQVGVGNFILETLQRLEQRLDTDAQRSNQKFDAVTQRFDAVTELLDAAEQRSNQRFDAVTQLLDAAEQRSNQ